MKTLTIIFSFCFLTTKIIGQIDTVTYDEQPDFTKTCDLKGNNCAYSIGRKKVTQAEYEKAEENSKKIENCMPCWLRYKDKTGRIVYEGDFYTDCCIGTYIERYKTGQIKIKGQYNIPVNNNKVGTCRRQGEWIYYGLNGDIVKKEIYQDGVLIK